MSLHKQARELDVLEKTRADIRLVHAAISKLGKEVDRVRGLANMHAMRVKSRCIPRCWVIRPLDALHAGCGVQVLDDGLEDVCYFPVEDAEARGVAAAVVDHLYRKGLFEEGRALEQVWRTACMSGVGLRSTLNVSDALRQASGCASSQLRSVHGTFERIHRMCRDVRGGKFDAALRWGCW